MNIAIDFITQLSVTVIGGLLTALLQPRWIRRPESGARGSDVVPAAGVIGTNGSGQQIVIGNTGSVSGSFTQTEITTVVQHPAGPSGQPVDPWVIAAVGSLIALIVAAVFLQLYGFLFWASIGVAGALVVMTVAAIVRSRRIFGTIPIPARLVLGQVALAVVALVVAWHGVWTVACEGYSVANISGRIPEFADPQANGPMLWMRDYLGYFTKTALPALVHQGFPAIMYVFLAVASVVIAVIVLFTARRSVVAWHAYVRCEYLGDQGGRAGSDAKKFLQVNARSSIWPALAFSLLSFVFARQWLFAWYLHARELGV